MLRRDPLNCKDPLKLCDKWQAIGDCPGNTERCQLTLVTVPGNNYRLTTAFDKVWKEGLKLKLRQHGVSGNLFTWIRQYLHNQKARVQLQGQKSRKKLLNQGVPQGGVLSPTLLHRCFLLLFFIDDIMGELSRKVHGAIYADDLLLSFLEEYVTTA